MIYTFATALIITFAIPVFGLFIELINKIAIKIISHLLGSKAAFVIANYITFPGVIHHELSHALFAFLTGAKIHEVALFKPQGSSLGHVTYSVRGIFIFQALQHTIHAIAPVFCGAVTSSAIIYFLCNVQFPLWAYIVLIYLLISIIMHMSMSSADIKNMWKGIPIVFILILIAVYYFQISLF